MSAVKKTIAYLIMALLSVVFIFPLIWAFLSSFKLESKMVEAVPQLFPDPFTLESYSLVLSRYPYMKWMSNSIMITVISTVLVLLISSMAAYAFANMEFRFKKPIFTCIIAMMLIPIQGYMIPLYLGISVVKFKASFMLSALAIILPAGANVTSVYILTEFFKTLPKSLQEAAWIDGCHDFGIFFRIILPLSKPALSSVAILTFISNWNSFLWPSIVLTTDKYLTLPVGIARYFGAAAGDTAFRYGPSLAAACMAIVPTMIVFLLLQRYFVEGIASSGIKG